MNSYLFPITSVESTDFREALAQNAATPMYNLMGFPALSPNWWLVRAISVIAKENFGPEFNFFSTAAGVTADPATDTFIARWGFTSNMGAQFGGAGLWRYYVDGLAIPYFDTDYNAAASQNLRRKLHVVLKNISATAKSANDNGNIVTTFWLEPMQAY